jgi:hypothetical protein
MRTKTTERPWWRTPRMAKKWKPAGGETTSGARHILRGPTCAIGCNNTRTNKMKPLSYKLSHLSRCAPNGGHHGVNSGNHHSLTKKRTSKIRYKLSGECVARISPFQCFGSGFNSVRGFGPTRQKRSTVKKKLSSACSPRKAGGCSCCLKSCLEF